MNTQSVRSAADQQSFAVQAQGLRHEIFAGQANQDGAHRQDRRDIDLIGRTGVSTRAELPGLVPCNARFSPPDRPNLLQTDLNGLVQEDIPAYPSLGADRTRFDVHPDRREGWRRAPESAALLSAFRQMACAIVVTWIYASNVVRSKSGQRYLHVSALTPPTPFFKAPFFQL